MSSPNAAAVLELIARMQPQKPYILAIDGRCASGKTTLANELSQSLSCNVVHMDDFNVDSARGILFCRVRRARKVRYGADELNITAC